MFRDVVLAAGLVLALAFAGAFLVDPAAASPAPVTAVTSVAAIQQTTGSLSGTIVDSSTGEPVAGEYVVVQMGPSGGAGAWTGSDGTYIIKNLIPGEYQVATGAWIEGEPSEYLQTWWPGVSNGYDAEWLSVMAGEEVTGIDFELALGGVVTGTITDAWTGEPIDEDWVSIEGWFYGVFGGFGGDRIDADGRFRLTGLSGEYRLEVYPTGYLSAESDLFTISAGEELTIDLAVTPDSGTPFATVAGVVCEVDEAGMGCWMSEVETGEMVPLGNLPVEAHTSGGTLLGATTTDTWGWFEFGNLDPGDIVVSLPHPPPGMLAAPSEKYTLGVNEGVWDVQLTAYRVGVDYGISSSITPVEIVVDGKADLRLEVVFTGVADPVEPFDVTNVVVAVHLPPALEYVAHSGDGPYHPTSGLWTVPTLPYLGTAEMTITVTASEEATLRPHAEIAAADWPAADAIFGDGHGPDHTMTRLEVVAAPIEPVVDAALIGGTVWLDTDDDGVMTDDDRGLSDVVVLATPEAGYTIEAVTGTNGTYRIDGIAAGIYRIDIDESSLPEGVAAPPTGYVVALGPDTLFLGADFICAPLVGGLSWWLFALGAAVLFSGLALIATMVIRRRRPPEGAAPKVEPKSSVPDVLVG